MTGPNSDVSPESPSEQGPPLSQVRTSGQPPTSTRPPSAPPAGGGAAGSNVEIEFEGLSDDLVDVFSDAAELAPAVPLGVSHALWALVGVCVLRLVELSPADRLEPGDPLRPHRVSRAAGLKAQLSMWFSCRSMIRERKKLPTSQCYDPSEELKGFLTVAARQAHVRGEPRVCVGHFAWALLADRTVSLPLHRLTRWTESTSVDDLLFIAEDPMAPSKSTGGRYLSTSCLTQLRRVALDELQPNNRG
jgi:hypothetical protein